MQLLLLAALAAAIPAQASEAIARKARCVSCHAMDKKRVGPAYKDVAAKYRGQPEAAARLVGKVRTGGTGVWGQVPMPPNEPDVLGDTDLKTMIEWVLQLE